MVLFECFVRVRLSIDTQEPKQSFLRRSCPVNCKLKYTNIYRPHIPNWIEIYDTPKIKNQYVSVFINYLVCLIHLENCSSESNRLKICNNFNTDYSILLLVDLYFNCLSAIISRTCKFCNVVVCLLVSKMKNLCSSSSECR